MTSRGIKQFIIFILLFAFVLLVNQDILSQNYIYSEQPEIYFANSQIHSLRDFFNVYLHPYMFNVFYIPFFRPSGHFLIYQILTPILGWHNTQAMLAVNFLFLALTGFYLIKLYQLLFPRMKIGGYIAFSLYLMHPALILSRLLILHFEFAYVFLVVLATYYFVRYCQGNYSITQPQINKIHFKNLHQLVGIVLLYCLAITFKETAIMLGPVLAAYLCVTLYSGQGMVQYAREVLGNKQIRNMLLLLMTITMALLIYISLQWPTFQNPVQHETGWRLNVSSAAELIKLLLASPVNLLPDSIYTLYHASWRELVCPPATRLLIWFCILATVVSIWNIRNTDTETMRFYRKSIAFLILSALVYLILPLGWGMGLPWHLSLTLLCLSMLSGFGVEYLLGYLMREKQWRMVSGGALALLIGLSTVYVNDENIAFAKAKYKADFVLMTNALAHPPAIQHKLNADSVIVIEDRTSHDGYSLGNYYPLENLINLGAYNINNLERSHSRSFLKFESIYAGTLFRWVYLKPELKEEVIPFEISKMNAVPDIVLYTWLQHKNNIFCLGYDDAGNWYDRTEMFKQKLAEENNRRQLTVHVYQAEPNVKWQGQPSGELSILIPEPSICQLQCDQAKSCQGFTYADVEQLGHHVRKCFYFTSLQLSAENNKMPCKVCTLYIKSHHPLT